MEVMSTPTELGSSGKDVAPKKQHFISEDERRIYGGGKQQHDPRETRIPMPGTDRATNKSSKGGIPSGPQPMNTLSSNSLTRQPNGTHRSGVNIQSSSSQGLQVRVSRGDNVQKSTMDFKEHERLEGPPTKRRKTAPASQDESVQTVGSDGIDELSLQNNELTPSLLCESRRPSQTISIQSQDTDRPQPNKEFDAVEKMMHSGKRPKKRNIRKSSARRYDGGEEPRLPTITALSAVTTIDLSGDDQPEAPQAAPAVPARYQGTANEAHKKFLLPSTTSKARLDQATGKKSCLFAKKSTAAPAISSLNRQVQHDATSRSDALDGKQRSGHVASSPDVLASATTVGAISRQPSPSKSSSSTWDSSTTKVGETELPRSIFPRSTFERTSRQGKISGSTRQKRPSPEADAAWAIRLSAVRVGNRMHTSTSLGLRYNPEIDAFDVMEGGKNWATEDLSFRIRPQKLHKALWSNPGKSVRFESARSGGADPVLDIETCSERDKTTLMQKIQAKHPFTVKDEKPEQMKKLLNHRLSQKKPQPITKGSRTNIAVDEGQEIELMAKRKAQRDHEISEKRPRLELRKIDNTGVFRYQWEESQHMGGLPDGPENIHRLDNNNVDDIEDELPDLRPHNPSKISSIMKRLAPKIPATYSTRSRSEKAPSVSQTLPSVRDEPAPIRYSKTQDMGKAWSKPLTYPKIGKKKATVEWTDLERLDEGEFFNDTLIEFYLRYLQHQVELNRPNLANKIHFFNTFFFKNLTHNGRSPAAKANNYRMVEKWTRGVDIFEKDFVVVPINEAFHWYVVVICNLPALNRQLSSLGDDPPSSLSANIDPALRDRDGGRSSPSPADPPTAQPAERSSEPDTRNSFEQLSLEQDNGSSHEKNDASDGRGLVAEADDQEMLDTQLNGDRAQAGNHGDVIDQLSQAAKTTAKQDNDLEQESTLQASASKRTGKRKSIPPGKKLDPSQPAIVTFDSLGTTHPSTVRVIKDYLLAEADNKRTMIFNEKQIKGMNAAGIPKQDNYCDCGPFLLGYVDKFMEDPYTFMSKALQKQLDIQKDWPLLGPSKLRTNIRELLFKLHREQEDERRESAKESGKYISRKTEPSPTRAPAQTEPKEKPTALVAGEPTKRPQSELAEKPAASIPSEPAKQVSRSTSPKPATFDEALEGALPIDAPEIDHGSSARAKSLQHLQHVSPSKKLHPIVVIPSQSQSQSQPHSRPSHPSPSPPTPTQLPSTIQDSQPAPSFEKLEEDMPTTPTMEDHEGPPEPVSPKTDTRGTKSRRLDQASFTIDTRGANAQNRGYDTAGLLRTSPRSVTRSKRREEPNEVIDLD